MRVLAILFTTFSILFSAVMEKDVPSFMQKNIDQAIKYIKENKTSKQEIADKIFDLFDGVFDFNLMAKLSLSSDWNKLNKEQQKEFVKAFEKRLKDSYIDKLSLYTNQDIVVTGAKKPRDNRMYIESELINNGKKYQIIYKFYDAQELGWLIYDVDILGVSIIQSYRNQLAGILDRETFKGLLSKLKDTQIQTKE